MANGFAVLAHVSGWHLLWRGMQRRFIMSGASLLRTGDAPAAADAAWVCSWAAVQNRKLVLLDGLAR
jgi:hypothetical protein